MHGQPATAAQWATGDTLTGTGLGLRSAHITQVLSQQPPVLSVPTTPLRSTVSACHSGVRTRWTMTTCAPSND